MTTEAIIVEATNQGQAPITLTGAGYKVRGEKWPRFVGHHLTRDQQTLHASRSTEYRVSTEGLPSSADVECFCVRDTAQKWHRSSRRHTAKQLKQHPWTAAPARSPRAQPGTEPIIRLPRQF